MAYKFIYGPNGTDKTEKCIDMMKRCIGRYKNIFYVVPEYLSFSAENKIINQFGAVSEKSIEVTSFKKLYYETANIVGEKGLKKLSSGGIRVILAYICLKNKKDLKMLSKAAVNKGFSDVLASVIQELKTYKISPEDLTGVSDRISDALKHKLSDIAKLYSAYNDFLECGFSDAQDEIGLLEAMIKSNPEIYKDCLFIFDGFQTFTPDQLGVISALCENADMAFSFTADDEENDTYISQKKCMKKLGTLLSHIEQKPSEKAETRQSFKNIPENEVILKNLLYGENARLEGAPENIEIHEFTEQYQEVEFVAEEIIKMVKAGARYKDIMVIARDKDRYMPVIESVFKGYEVPVFIDKKLEAANQPALCAVLSALEIVKNNFTYESVFTYLKSGFTNIESFETDLLENYIIATGIRGNSWLKDWQYLPYVSKIFDSDEQFLEKINEVRIKVTEPIITLKNSLSGAKTVRDKCAALYDFICEINIFDKISGLIERFKENEPQTAAYYGRVWSLLMKTLDEVVEVLGDEKLSTDEFIELFTMGLSVHEISIVPTNVDVVSVTVPENISDSSEKYVFVVGANDGVYPSIMQTEGLLSDRDRGVLEGLGIELAQDTLTKAIEENYITLKAFLSAENKLYISYPIGDTSGGARFPSVTVKRIKGFFPELEVQSHVVSGGMYGDEKIVRPGPSFAKYAVNLRQGKKLSDKWVMAGEWYKQNESWSRRYNLLESTLKFAPRANNLTSDLTDRLYKDELNVSVSSIEQYARCPFAHYANYILKLRPRDKAEISVADTGSIMHEAIEKLSARIVDNGYTWKSAPDDFLKRESVKVADELVIELEKRFEYTSISQVKAIARIKEMIEQSVMYIAEHLKAGKFEPLGYEIEFGMGKNYSALTFDIGGKKIKLRGKVDRADIYYDDEGNKYVRVIDYKSGQKNFDFPYMFYGLQIQLVAYLDRMCEETGAQPAGILYFRLFDPTVDVPEDIADEDISNIIAKEHKMSGIVLDDDKIINAMDVSGDRESRIIPVKRNKDGTLSKNSSVISAEGFRDMQKHINRYIKKIGRSILDGKIAITPSKYGDSKGCDYCDFKYLCLFDEECGGRYNVLEKLQKEEVMYQISKEGEENV
ncbi:MAG: PD-(D/E)XK nuclease family protein [Monoglobales bacterium]